MIEHQQEKGSNVKKRLILTAFTASAFALTALGQGTFQNLDFEAARVVFVATNVYSFIATSNALPGWTAFSGTNQLSVVAFNPGGMVVEPVGLYGSDAPVVIGGSFSLGLEAGGSVSQTALVPADAKLLLFKDQVFGSSSSPLVVSLNGQNLSYTALFSGPNYTLYGTDISAFAGKSATLTFLAPLPYTDAVLDDIEFAVPEPSVLALLGLACAVLALSAVRRECLRSRRRRITSNGLPG